MGQRANLIIVANGSVEIYYTHHRANTLDKDLFWGPEYVKGFIRAQQPVPNGNLLDEIWAEGGAVMDCDNKHLLWFGGEFLTGRVPLRRMHAKLMSSLWKDWTIQWASEGVADIARYVQRPVESVLSNRKYDPFNPSNLRPVGARAPCANVVTFLYEAQVYLFKFLLPASRLGFNDAGLTVSRLVSLASEQPTWDGSFNSTYFWSGMVVDHNQKSLDLWTATDFPDAVNRLTSKWSGWTIRWHEDRFEEQVIRSMGLLHPPSQSNEEMIGELREWLLWPDSEQSDAETAYRVGTLLGTHTGIKTVEINPEALRDARLMLPVSTRVQLLDAALDAAANCRAGGMARRRDFDHGR